VAVNPLSLDGKVMTWLYLRIFSGFVAAGGFDPLQSVNWLERNVDHRGKVSLEEACGASPKPA
jgi:hypothetical protein